jgi:ketosteroid isomerase-like protein
MDMGEQENTKLVRTAYEIFKSGNIPALLGMFSDNISWRLPDIETVPFAGRRQGREQMGQFFAALAETQEARRFEAREFIAQGDKVVALGHYTWHVKSTGRDYGGDWAHVITVHNGMIVEFQVHCCLRVFTDRGALVKKLEAAEPIDIKGNK